MPGAKGRRDFGHDPIANLGNQAGRFGNRDELARHAQPVARVRPAQQRLGADEFARDQAELRLVSEDELVSLHRIEWFFPAMLCVIGGRYLCFHTMFGLRAYLLCGAVLAAGGWLLVRFNAGPAAGAFAGAAIETVFAIAVLLGARAAAASRGRTSHAGTP